MRYAIFCLSTLLLGGALAAEEYTLGPDSQRQPGVPAGKVTKYSAGSRIFPGTTRDYWVYVPSQYDASTPACLMVVQDGGGWVTDSGSFRAHIVFDNLIHRKEMPVTIGIFINPGVTNALGANQQSRYNRSLEYDGLGDRYARYLIEEIIPEVAKQYNISSDPNDRAIGGSSSGAIAAFTAAWNRPDAFRRVLSYIGSYTNLRGGDIYPGLIRKTEPKPLRVFLQDGQNDLNIYSGSWFHANQEMAAALAYAGYESKFVIGTEGHNGKHGSAILPDAMRWLWQEYPKQIAASKGRAKAERQFVTEILDPDAGWELLSTGHRFTEGPAVDHNGNVFFADIPNNRIHKISTDGKVSVFKEDTGGANGLMFGADGRLFAAQNGRKKVVAYAPDGKETTIADGFESNDLAVTSKGGVYVTDPPGKRVWYIDPGGKWRVVYASKGHDAIVFPNGVRLSPDESLLHVVDYSTKWIWSFQIQPDGSLDHGEAFTHLETPDDMAAGGDGFTLDTQGHIYVATRMGIQICDQPGRVVGIIGKPQAGSLSNAVFGGPNLDYLYVTAGDKVFRRHLRRKGFFPWQPLMPPRPQL